MHITEMLLERIEGWVVSADVDRCSSSNNAGERVDWFPGKNINRKKQEAKPTGGRPFNSNESITCALWLSCSPRPRGGSF